MTRRHLLATLAGSVLGRVIGPMVIPEPAVELWESIPGLPPKPVENTYVPLEAIADEVLRIIDENLKWLRLERHLLQNLRGECWRVGDEVSVAQHMRFCPHHDIDDFRGMDVQRLRVPLNRTVHGGLHVRDTDFDRPFDQLSKAFLEPVACGMADHIIGAIRSQGDAAVLATLELPQIATLERCVLATRPDTRLSVRAIQAQSGPLELQMVYGLA